MTSNFDSRGVLVRKDEAPINNALACGQPGAVRTVRLNGSVVTMQLLSGGWRNVAVRAAA